MIDPRYEHAQLSNQGGDRGWNFSDPKPPIKAAPKSRKDTPTWLVVYTALAWILLMSFAWIMTQ